MDDVPDDVKRRRNVELLAVQERISMRNNTRLIGREFEILVEGYSKAARKLRRRSESGNGDGNGNGNSAPITTGSSAPHGLVQLRQSGNPLPQPSHDQLTGRTRGDQIVVYPGQDSDIGRVRRVRITAASPLTLHATPI